MGYKRTDLLNNFKRIEDEYAEEGEFANDVLEDDCSTTSSNLGEVIEVVEFKTQEEVVNETKQDLKKAQKILHDSLEENWLHTCKRLPFEVIRIIGEYMDPPTFDVDGEYPLGDEEDEGIREEEAKGKTVRIFSRQEVGKVVNIILEDDFKKGTYISPAALAIVHQVLEDHLHRQLTEDIPLNAQIMIKSLVNHIKELKRENESNRKRVRDTCQSLQNDFDKVDFPEKAKRRVSP